MHAALGDSYKIQKKKNILTCNLDLYFFCLPIFGRSEKGDDI